MESGLQRSAIFSTHRTRCLFVVGGVWIAVGSWFRTECFISLLLSTQATEFSGAVEVEEGEFLWIQHFISLNLKNCVTLKHMMLVDDVGNHLLFGRQRVGSLCPVPHLLEREQVVLAHLAAYPWTQ